MNSKNCQQLDLIYEGSVKRVFRKPQETSRLLFAFTDDYSVFDWGKMPDQIANKGRALTLIGAHLFDVLAKPEFWRQLPSSKHLQKFDADWLRKRFEHRVFCGETGLTVLGAPSHFLGLVQENGEEYDHSARANGATALMEVLAAAVHRPELHKLFHHSLYIYPANAAKSQTRLIPLEIVFRFGMPRGSSLTERLKKDPDYARDLGIKMPEEGKLFEHPVLEFYTKLEPKDRLLSWQEATLLAGLSGAQFEDMVELALDTALAVHVIFAEKNIELWDGKFEMILYEGKLLLADSIGPDELRLLYERCQLSKEIIRQMYRDSEWLQAVKEAQRLAKHDNKRTWKEIAIEQFHAAPEPLPPQSKLLANQLYGVLANELCGAGTFPNHPSLAEYARTIPEELKVPAEHDTKTSNGAQLSSAGAQGKPAGGKSE